MSFDIHALDDLYPDTEETETALKDFVAALSALAFPSAENPETGKTESPFYVEPFIELGFVYLGATLPRMTLADARRILEELFPSKIVIGTPAEVDDILAELTALWQFLQTEFNLANAAGILKYLRRLKPQFPKLMFDESRYGVAKTVVMQARAAGVDPFNPDEMEDFMAEYNRRLGEDEILEEVEEDPDDFVTLADKQQEYAPPVADLLALGEETAFERIWQSYPHEYGLTPEHIPELIRLAVDKDILHNSDGPVAYAAFHAWRALGQLKAAQAAEPLCSLLPMIDIYQHDWVGEDVPIVLGMIGRPALEPVRQSLSNEDYGLWARVGASYALEQIGQKDYAARPEAIQGLIAQLAAYESQDPTLNAFLISFLVDLKGLEGLDLMQQAFAADCVDLSVGGDWEEVQIELGLLKERLTPQPEYHLWRAPLLEALRSSQVSSSAGSSAAGKKEKKKKKQEKRSRRKNRKKKE